MTQFAIEEELDDLSSTEDFLNFFNIEYNQKVVHINRLHIMQRYHDYLEKAKSTIDLTEDEDVVSDIYKTLLKKAYEDFVDSDAQTEKVLKVFKMNEPQTGFVSVDELLS